MLNICVLHCQVCFICCADTAVDVDMCCKDGLKEAESCQDIEMQAEFLYCGAIFCLVSEKPVDKVVVILQVCMLIYSLSIKLTLRRRQCWRLRLFLIVD